MQTVVGSTLLYSLTREALFTKARSAHFHSLYNVAFSKPVLGDGLHVDWRAAVLPSALE